MKLSGKIIVIGLSGSIACYKAAELVRRLCQEGSRVRVIMTKNAQEFITPLTLQTLSGQPVATETFSLTQESEIGHIRLADSAEVVVIAPATANVIGKIAAGIADDLLTTVVMATRAPVLVAPAMNVHMYENPLLQANFGKLKSLGYRIIDPEEGYLACGYEGPGRLADAETVVEEIKVALSPKDLAGEKVLVTAGPTQEALDPVRFFANRSSGKMGFALARVARRRGADVALVSGPTAFSPPRGVRCRWAMTAAEMLRAVKEQYDAVTIVIMAAAVADYRPADTAGEKLKKGGERLVLELEPTPDILAALAKNKGSRLLIGFAAETGDIVAHSEKKLRQKNLDLVVANDVTQPGAGFESDTNVVTIVDTRGRVESLPQMTKEEVAEAVCDRIVALRRDVP